LRLYPNFKIDDLLHMPSVTFFALLSEGSKLEVIEMKKLLMVASFTSFDEDKRKEILDSLILPEDVLSDILESENPDDINTLKEALENAN